VVEGELEDGHGGSEGAMLHGLSRLTKAV
jgi:hypothetical protein